MEKFNEYQLKELKKAFKKRYKGEKEKIKEINKIDFLTEKFLFAEDELKRYFNGSFTSYKMHAVLDLPKEEYETILLIDGMEVFRESKSIIDIELFSFYVEQRRKQFFHSNIQKYITEHMKKTS